MLRKLLCYLPILFISHIALSQGERYQGFDGPDTMACCAIFIDLDTSASNIWQIGKPNKAIFDGAFTIPNVIVTDTINFYPIDNSSSFTFTISDLTEYTFGGILALQWTQKLDLDENLDGGFVHYSIDGGDSWVNTFNDPYVYNFYGYDEDNKDTLIDGRVAFSGTDTNWRDIWLCFDISWLTLTDSIQFKFTLESDSIDNNREGWMIDNFFVHPTWFHTIDENEQANYIDVFPNPTNGILNIRAKKSTDFHIIESIQISDDQGNLVKEYGLSPTYFHIDLSDLPAGVYLVKIQTNIKTETFKVIREG